MNSRHKTLAALDRRHIWHPFTQMRDWIRSEPVVIVEGKGARIRDARGKWYLDANSSIWTNLHGHRHPRITGAIRRQLQKISHSSSLGFANEPASLLSEKLIGLAPKSLKKVFYSDDGSTALEAALKMAFQSRNDRGQTERNAFLSLENSYHGDTVGAMSLGGMDVFHQAYRPLLFRSTRVMAPYCYRCPHNRARPERADARMTRKCGWECVSHVEKKLQGMVRGKKPTLPVAAVIEPLIQGAAGMIAHPRGYLEKFARLCRQSDVPLILDEVMTGFGRTGTFFASEQEIPPRMGPDLLCLAKGLTGGHLPLAATLASRRIFDAFLGEYSEKKTFFHGHSYTGNQLGCAAALANLETFQKEQTLQRIEEHSAALEEILPSFWKLSHVGDVRRVGLIAGIELVRDWRTREPYRWEERVGVRVCEEARKMGVLTRPIGNVLVIMPPFCIKERHLATICEVLVKSVKKVCGK